MSIPEELEYIRGQHEGILFPNDVVEYARGPNTELHSRFEWDDSSAAEKYRLEQARGLIRVCVTILPNKDRVIDTYVSLKQDRYSTGGNGNQIGGYRSSIEVMLVPKLRKTLLEEAMEEHESWEQKYRDIVELADIFATARSVKAKQELKAIA